MRKTLNILRTAVAVLAVTAAVQACMHLGKAEGPLDGLYNSYAPCDDLRVALLLDKGVGSLNEQGDSIRVDMLMLTATDSAAWQRLRSDFAAPQPVEAMQRRIDNGDDIVTVGRYRNGDSSACALRVVSYLNRTVSIVLAANDDDLHAVLCSQMEDNIKNTII